MKRFDLKEFVKKNFDSFNEFEEWLEIEDNLQQTFEKTFNELPTDSALEMSGRIWNELQ